MKLKKRNTDLVVLLVTVISTISLADDNKNEVIKKDGIEYKKDFYNEELGDGAFIIDSPINLVDTLHDDKKHTSTRYHFTGLGAKCASYDLKEVYDLEVSEILVKEFGHFHEITVSTKEEKKGFCALLFVPEWMSDNKSFKFPIKSDEKFMRQFSLGGEDEVSASYLNNLRGIKSKEVAEIESSYGKLNFTVEFFSADSPGAKVLHIIKLNNESIVEIMTESYMNKNREGQYYKDGGSSWRNFRTIVNILDVNGDGKIDFLFSDSYDYKTVYFLYISGPGENEFKVVEYKDLNGC